MINYIFILLLNNMYEVNIMLNKKTTIFLLSLMILIISLSTISASDVVSVSVGDSVTHIDTQGKENIKTQEPITKDNNKTTYKKEKSSDLTKNTEKSIITDNKITNTEKSSTDIKSANIQDKSIKTVDKSVNLKKESVTHIVTNTTFNDFFNNGTLTDKVNAGDTLDFQGLFRTTNTTNYTMLITKPINMISSTHDSNISLNSTSKDFFGKDSGDSVSFYTGSSGSNVTGLYFYNTQIFVWTASNITFDNITKITENQKIGGGVGSFSIRANSTYITVKNSYFKTENSHGHSTLVGALASYCTFDNNTIQGDGMIGNLIYFTTYNIDVHDIYHTNEYNRITNNRLSAVIPQSICYAIVTSGCHNLIENNTINYRDGMGITIQWGSGAGEGEGSGMPTFDNIYRGNVLLNGTHFNPSSNSTVVNNSVDGNTYLNNNTIAYNNTFNSLEPIGIITISNSTINNLTFRKTSLNNSVIVENSNIGSVKFQAASSGYNTQNITLKNNNILGNMIVSELSGRVNNINITSNNITGILAFGDKKNQVITNISIINNRIISQLNYTVKTTQKSANITIKNNALFAKDVYGNDAVLNGAKEKESIIILNNMPTANKTNTTLTLDSFEPVKINKTFTITGKLTDNNSNAITNANILLIFNGVATVVKTNSEGVYSHDYVVDNFEENTLIVSDYNNGALNATYVSVKFNATKINTQIILNPIETPVINSNMIISGKLVDVDGNIIPDTTVALNINNNTYDLLVDSNGTFEYVYNVNSIETINITLSYSGNNSYNPSVNATSVNVRKIKTTITVTPINEYIGENITLTANLLNEYGNPVTGGNIVFKINGKTLRTDGKFNSDMPPMKFSVVNGIVTYTLNAESYLCNARNITATYSGSGIYEESRSSAVDIKLNKRIAFVNLTLNPSVAKQNDNIIFMVSVKDITPNTTNTIVKNGKMIFKINGKTLKDEDGNIIILNVTDGMLNFTYKVPLGLAATDNANNIRNYMVEAVYSNKIYTSYTKANTTFTLEKSDISFNYDIVTYNTTSKKLLIKANLTDYMGNLVVGTNKICIKVNEKSIMDENNQIKYFMINNGQIDLSDIQLTNNMVNSITLVTGQREAYNEVRNTTTIIENKP